MTLYLDQARHASSDPLEVPMIPFAQRVYTGARGRPRVEIDPNLLSAALTLGPKTRVAKTASCSARTIRRRQKDYGIITTPGLSRQADTSDLHPHPHEITDEQLDRCLSTIIQDFPTFGRRLATAALRADGIMVPESRVRDSLARVSGTPGIFGGRRVHRRCYKVAGANSLWHHDGQHGMCLLPNLAELCLRHGVRLDSMEDCDPRIH